MKITNPNTQNTWEVDLEPELLNRISEINIDSPNEITITFHDNPHPESNTSIFKKILNIIKEWRWVIGGSTLTTIFVPILNTHVIIFLILVIITLFYVLNLDIRNSIIEVFQLNSTED